MASKLVNTAFKKFMDGDIDLLADTIKLMLVKTTHTPNIDTEEFIDDVSADEVTPSGDYSAGGVALGTKTTTVNTTNDRCEFGAANVTFTAVDFSAQYAYIYKDTGTPATSPIIGYVDFGSDKNSDGGNFVITWTGGKIFYLGN